MERHDRCHEAASKLRTSLVPLRVKYKPNEAPQKFLTPSEVRSILQEFPLKDIFLCPCSTCEKFSGYTADDRVRYYNEVDLLENYAPMMALLIVSNCAGLIYEFQQRQLRLDKPLQEDELAFMSELQINAELSEVETRKRLILDEQYSYTACVLNVDDVFQEVGSKEALPIEDDDDQVGKGAFGEVFAFKIMNEYKGEGYRHMKASSFHCIVSSCQ